MIHSNTVTQYLLKNVTNAQTLRNSVYVMRYRRAGKEKTQDADGKLLSTVLR